MAGISYRFDQPMIVGVAGPNGAGKTTLIRMMLGLTRPSEGSVTVADLPPRRMYSRRELAVGYMPQTEAIYADLTVRQNIAFYARLHRLPRGLRRQRVQEALDVVALQDRQDDRISSLSGGMRRRVSLACALVHRPRLLVLDEPTVGVDPELRATMWRSFQRLRDEGTLIFVSTHYLSEAAKCDVVVFLRAGAVLAADEPARLMKRTKTTDLEDAFLRLLEEAKP